MHPFTYLSIHPPTHPPTHSNPNSLEATPACVGVHTDTVQRLSNKANELMAEKVRRADRLKALGDQIAELWDRLKVSDGEREAFSSSVNGLGPDTLAAGEEELARLQALKKEMLGSLIEETRTQVCIPPTHPPSHPHLLIDSLLK